MTAKAARRSRTVPELFDALRASYSDGPPTEETVRAQGFPFYRRHWVARWPPAIALPPSLAHEDAQGSVDRDSLLRSAASVTNEHDAVDFYVRVCSWGSGTKARGIARCVKPLHQPGAAEALLATHTLVRSGDSVGAYASLWRGGEHRIKHLGPAFFTKWMYFSGYEDCTSNEPAPLILDARVANALGWWPYGWSVRDYGTYLERAEQIRQQWCPDRGAHVVEYALFKMGGKNEGVDGDR